jgi:hypothetical protein
MLHGKSRGNENHAKNDENMGIDENSGEEETGRVCFMAIGEMEAPELDDK